MSHKSVSSNEIGQLIENVRKLAEKRGVERPSVEYNRETNTIKINRREGLKSTETGKVEWGDRVLDQGYTLIPNTLLDNYANIGMTPGELAVVIMLLRYSFGSRKPYPSVRTLAQRTGASERTVKRQLKRMKIMGYLAVYKRYLTDNGTRPRRTSNVYSLKGLLNKLRDGNGV